MRAIGEDSVVIRPVLGDTFSLGAGWSLPRRHEDPLLVIGDRWRVLIGREVVVVEGKTEEEALKNALLLGHKFHHVKSIERV